MKAVVVEGKFDLVVLETLFPQCAQRRIMLREAHGFSNVFAVTKALKDYGYDVLAVLDTDTDKPGNDNRKVIERIQTTGIVGRAINIVWMDANIEDVLKRANPNIHLQYGNGIILQQGIRKYKNAILALEEFRKIQEFIGG